MYFSLPKIHQFWQSQPTGKSRVVARVEICTTPSFIKPLANERSIVDDKTPLPPQAATEEEDEELFAEDPWVEPPIRVDYGTNVELGQNVFINFNATILDTCKVTIGARTLLASNVSLFSGTHPLDPKVRNGTKGPETGAEIHIEEDCWLGGNVTVLPGIRIGKGSVVGAGSVVTKVWFSIRCPRCMETMADLRPGCTTIHHRGRQPCEEDQRCATMHAC